MTTWDGTERRKEYGRHMDMLPECVQVFKRVEEKVDELVASTRLINGRYQKHLEEAIPYRSKVDEISNNQIKHDVYKNQLTGTMIGIIFAIILQIITFAVLWGRLSRTVEVNTGRLDAIEAIHPRLVNAGTRS